MKKLKVASIALLLAIGSSMSEAQSGNLRLIFHTTKVVTDSGFLGWDAWVIAPNITTVPNKWLIVAGPRLQGKGWWSEFNVGAFVQSNKTTPSIDIRTSWPAFRQLSFWTNFEWNDFSTLYMFGEINHKLLKGAVLAGLESENSFPKTSLGPHVVIPFGTNVFTTAYQFAKSGNQLWFRLALNFH